MRRILLPLSALIAGCAADPALLRTDNSKVAQAMTQQRAVVDLKCPGAEADWPLRGDRMEDWPDELYSEYQTWAEGCGRRVRYVVVCHADNRCAFADRPLPPAD